MSSPSDLFITHKIIDRYPTKTLWPSSDAPTRNEAERIILNGGRREKRKFRQYAKKLRLAHDF